MSETSAMLYVTIAFAAVIIFFTVGLAIESDKKEAEEDIQFQAILNEWPEGEVSNIKANDARGDNHYFVIVNDEVFAVTVLYNEAIKTASVKSVTNVKDDELLYDEYQTSVQPEEPRESRGASPWFWMYWFSR